MQQNRLVIAVKIECLINFPQQSEQQSNQNQLQTMKIENRKI